jgi:hypothetical protein
MRSLSAGVFIASVVASWSFLTMAAGVPFRKKKAFQVMASKLVRPCSCAVASVGKSGERLRANSAMPLSVLPVICGNAPALLEHM